jgi:His/Glu/Gln/Arg/opine family amino acid ABC transporter permease subunit
MIVFSGYGTQLLIGALMTMAVALFALVIGTAIGVSVGAAKSYGRRPLRYLAETYTAVVRGVPDLIVIYLFYFGSSVALSKVFGRYVDVSPFGAGAASLSFIFGAYAGDVFRGAIQQVPKGQVEAAAALGLPKMVAFFKVILPQAWRVALPGFGNLATILLKQTSLVSVIGLEELLRASAVVSGSTRQPFFVYSAAAAIYLAMIAVMTALLLWARRRSDHGYR